MDELRADQASSLRFGTSLLRPAHTRALLALAFGLPVVAGLAVIYAVASGADGEICPAIWTALRHALMENPANRMMLWLVAGLTPLVVTLLVLNGRARICVTPAGLDADIPRWFGFGPFRQTAGQWSVSWDDVRRVHLVFATKARYAVQRLASCRLVIETPHGQIVLAAFQWFRRGQDHRLELGELLAFRKMDTVARLRSAPLIRAIEERGIAIEPESAPAQGPSRFDLAQHKGMLAQVCLFFGAGLYAMADTFFAGSYVPLGPLPILPFAVVGVITVLAVAKFGRGAPMTERLGLGSLVVIACVSAVYPATLRVNAGTAEPEIVTYVSAGEGVFRPPVEGLPPIDLAGEGVAEYWSQYPPGAGHEFTLQKGLAGFYQLDRSALYERTRQFYSDRR